MLKIGDFSKLTHVSIRMLRHYDELGVLKPARVDSESGYRYYSAEQLPRLKRILALQDLGFSLKQIASLLAQDLPLLEPLRPSNISPVMLNPDVVDTFGSLWSTSLLISTRHSVPPTISIKAPLIVVEYFYGQHSDENVYYEVSYSVQRFLG